MDAIDLLGQRQHLTAERGGLLLYRYRFAGQGRFIGGEAGCFDEAAVCRDEITGLNQDQISGDQLPGRQLEQIALPDHLGCRCAQGFQGSKGSFCFIFLNHTQDGIEQDHGQDHDGIGSLPDRQGDHRGSDQQQDQKFLELVKKHPPKGHPFLLVELVQAVLLLPPFDLNLGQTPVAIRIKHLRRLLGIKSMPSALHKVVPLPEALTRRHNKKTFNSGSR